MRTAWSSSRRWLPHRRTARRSWPVGRCQRSRAQPGACLCPRLSRKTLGTGGRTRGGGTTTTRSGSGTTGAQVEGARPRRSKTSFPKSLATSAEMDEEVVNKRATTIKVLVSREIIGQLVHAAAAEGKAEIDPSRKLLIQVLPKVNFESMDEGWVEIDPPQAEKPQSLYFDLKATHEGDGEVWVVARRGQVPLVTLVLKPRIVKTKNQPTRRALATATTAEAPKLSSPLHQLVILERRNGDEISYRYQLQSPALQLLKWGDSKPILGNRQKYVEDVYAEIENRWLSNKEDTENFLEELRAIGHQMFKELIQPDVQQVLWDHRDKIESILVIAKEPFIPWELVHLGEPGKSLSAETRFLGQMGLVRWLHEAGWPNELLTIRKGKANYVIPHYPHPDYVLPEAQLESQFLETEFGAAAVEPKSGTVRKLLSQPGAFDLLHFACHGVADQDNISGAALDARPGRRHQVHPRSSHCDDRRGSCQPQVRPPGAV